ncbi:MAG: CotS family spore coat protein [Clostridium sp.]
MNSEIQYLQTSNLSPEIIKKYVLPQFNLQGADISIIKFKNTDKQRAVYRVYSKNCNYCLKKVYYELSDLLYVYSAIEWLYRNDIRVPRFLPTKYNSRFARFDNMLFTLTPWIDGEKCCFDDINHIEISIKKLAQMHSISRNFKPILGSSLREGFDDYYISTLKHFQDLLRSSNDSFKYRDKFSKQFISNFDLSFLLAQTSLNLSNKINKDNLSRSLCHGDYVNKNIIIPKDNNPWIIDFDKCKMDYCARDISYFLRRLLKRQNTNWNLNLALNILEIYNKITPLTQDDIYYIVSYICFPQKYWKISRDYFKNVYKCNKNSFITLLNSATSRLEYQYNFSVNIIDSLNL